MGMGVGEDIDGGLETDRDRNTDSCINITPSIVTGIVR